MDSLRAIAALAVLATHASVFAGLQAKGSALGPYAARLEVGVAIFFVISGVLLYRPFVRSRVNGEPRPATGPYAWRRFLRIVPAYWLALTLVTLWLGLESLFTAEGIARFYGIAQAYDTSTIGGGLSQAWSLTIEVAFYAFLPAWAWLIARLFGADSRGSVRVEAVALALLFAAAVAWNAVILSGSDPDQVVITPALLALPAYLDHFALGMGLAVVSVWAERGGALPRGVRWIEARPGLSWLVALVAFWAVSTQAGLRGEFFAAVEPGAYMARHLLYGLIAVAVVAPAVLGDQRRGLVRRALAWRPLAWLGLVSYGIFLWNLAVLHKLEDWGLEGHGAGPYLAWIAAATLVTAAIAAASYYALERPALKLKRLFGDQPPRAEALEEPAPVAVPGRPGG